MRLRSSTTYGSNEIQNLSVSSSQTKKTTPSPPKPPNSPSEQWSVLESFMQYNKTLPSWFVETYVSELTEDTRTNWFTKLFCMCFSKGFAGDYEKRYRQLVRLCISSKTIVRLEEIARCIRDLENIGFDEVVQRFKRFRVCFVDAKDSDSVEVYHHYTSEFIDERRSELNGTVYCLLIELYSEIPFPISQVEYFLIDIKFYNCYMIERNPEWYPVMIPEYLYQISETNPIQVYKRIYNFTSMNFVSEIEKLCKKGLLVDDYLFDIYFHYLTYGLPCLFEEVSSISYMILNQHYNMITRVSKHLDILSIFYNTPYPIEHKYQICTKMIPVFIQTLQEVKLNPICKYNSYYHLYERYFISVHRTFEQTHQALKTLEEMVNDFIVTDLTNHLQKLFRLVEDIQKQLFPQIANITSHLIDERHLSRVINEYL